MTIRQGFALIDPLNFASCRTVVARQLTLSGRSHAISKGAHFCGKL